MLWFVFSEQFFSCHHHLASLPHDSRGGISKGFAQALAGWARLDTKSLKSGNVFEYSELCLLKIFSNIQSLPESQLVRLAGDVREDLPVQLWCFRTPHLFVNASKKRPYICIIKAKNTIKQQYLRNCTHIKSWKTSPAPILHLWSRPQSSPIPAGFRKRGHKFATDIFWIR